MTVIAAIVAVLGVIAAVVVLSLAGSDPGEVALLVAALLPTAGVLVTLVDRASKVLDETRHQSRVLSAIDHQTNGSLDDRIAAAVASALENRFGPAPNPSQQQRAA